MKEVPFIFGLLYIFCVKVRPHAAPYLILRKYLVIKTQSILEYTVVTVLWKLKKPEKNSPESSFLILSLLHPTESPWSKMKNFYVLGCVVFCDLPNSMA